MSRPLGSVLVQVESLVKHFSVRLGAYGERRAVVHAVDGISFCIHGGETLALVGESGCGKSTVGLTILQLHRPTAGKVYYQGQDLTGLTEKALRPIRRKMALIFQDPYSTLNPRMTVGAAIAEPLLVHHLTPKEEVQERVHELLQQVGLSPACANRYPHEFSGGQRQRIGIARAIATRPRLIVADEPTSALDVSVQAQILNLLRDLQARFGLTYLFISHNIGVIRHISDRVAVMYLGKIVELAAKRALFEHPAHPYTQALLAAVPKTDPRRRESGPVLEGDVPSPVSPPPGCRFHTRCPRAMAVCRNEEPAFRPLADGRHVACHLYG